MGNRIIKETISTSDKIASLSDFEFRLWIGLITQADDAGRGDARPAVIKGHVFPLRDRVTAKDIDAALHGLAAKGCVSLYKVGGKPYFWFPTWAEHQRIRDVKPKYPGPENADCGGLPQIAADCGSSPQIAADCGLNTIQSEYESESEGRDARARAKPAPEKRPYGEFGRVMLADAEREKLLSRLGEAKLDRYLASLDRYVESTGKAYKSHYATILAWAQKDEEKREEKKPPGGSFDIDAFERHLSGKEL